MSSKKQREITQTGKTGNTASPAGPVWLSTGEDGCILAVHAQPGAKRNAVAGIYNDRLKIALSAPPVDGKANAMLIRLQSKKRLTDHKHGTVGLRENLLGF